MMTNSDDSATTRSVYSDDDLLVAEEVLAAAGVTPDSDQYKSRRVAYAVLRANIGADRFDLLYGRRQPRNANERLEMRSQDEGWSPERYRDELKAFVFRSIDRTMIREYHDAIEQRILAYSSAINAVIKAVTDQHDSGRADREENEISVMFVSIGARLPMFKEEIQTVDEFLTRLRTIHGGPVTCGDYSGRNAHAIVLSLISNAEASWNSCVEIAHRSRSNTEYTETVSAAHLFYATHIEVPSRPLPQDLQALLAVEFAEADATLKRGIAPPYMPVSVVNLKALVDSKGRNDSVDDPRNWLTARSFGSPLRERIRKAVGPKRLTKRVRSKKVNGTTFYFLPDIRTYWPDDLPENLR